MWFSRLSGGLLRSLLLLLASVSTALAITAGALAQMPPGMNTRLFDYRFGTSDILRYPPGTDATHSFSVCSIIAYQPDTDDDMGVRCDLTVGRDGVRVTLHRLYADHGYFVAQAIVFDTRVWGIQATNRFQVGGNGGSMRIGSFIPDRDGVTPLPPMIAVVDTYDPNTEDRLSYTLGDFRSSSTAQAWGATSSARVKGTSFYLTAPDGHEVIVERTKLITQGNSLTDRTATQIITFAALSEFVSNEPDFGLDFRIVDGAPAWFGVNGDQSSHGHIRLWRFR